MKVKCTQCGKVCANNTGLAQHICFNHKEKKQQATNRSLWSDLVKHMEQERASHINKAGRLAEAIEAVEQAFARD